VGGADVSTGVSNLSLNDEKKATPADDKKSTKPKPTKPTKPTHSDSDSHSDDDDDDDAPKAKPTTAAAIRSKPVVTGSGVLIRKEERTKRKFTTTVKGMETFGCDLKKAAKSFSKKFACSASVVKVNEGGLEVQIQGDVQLELPDFIVQEFKIEKQHLWFLDKANKKTRCF
jgi:density-regulated protein DRP1